MSGRDEGPSLILLQPQNQGSFKFIQHGVPIFRWGGSFDTLQFLEVPLDKYLPCLNISQNHAYSVDCAEQRPTTLGPKATFLREKNWPHSFCLQHNKPWVSALIQILAFMLLPEYNLLYAFWWMFKAIIFKMDKSWQEVSKSINWQEESVVQFYTSL